ncbi:TMEM175 family protein [Nitrosovibrio tenuis]|uniref:Uncharacterized protein n=1 Tax=Nitrosovibrio tenuis TaxID=1233 RepID=A0A1H7PWE7_9PROT|nr:TMEM175 family protein [Nitrosovibrio tenuis]SEL40062.1 Protein of unknown function [Nitrosovibrio tenuis]
MEMILLALHHLIPVFISYVLSLVYVGIYWNNHHHLFHAVQEDKWTHSVGQSAPAFLAFSSPICHRLDGRKSLFHIAGRFMARFC